MSVVFPNRDAKFISRSRLCIVRLVIDITTILRIVSLSKISIILEALFSVKNLTGIDMSSHTLGHG